MNKLLIIQLFLLPYMVNAQHQGDVWVFPNGNKLNFSSVPPSTSAGSQIFPEDIEVEGVTSISDQDGNLLFYSDGVTLWDMQDNIVTNSLMGHQSSTNSAYVVPIPGSQSKYYLFTLDAMQNNLANGLRYSVIHACKDSGVSVFSSNQLLSENMTEKMTAIIHSNEHDYWLVTHEFGTTNFKIFLIDSNGISLNNSYSCGSIHGPQLSAAIGQIKASPDGKMIAMNITNNQLTEILSFDNSNGTVDCLVSFTPDTSETGNLRGAYGVSFSPNSKYLYLSGNARFRLWQFDLSQLSISNQAFYSSKITLSEDSFSSGTTFHQLQLAQDGKIYCTSWNNQYLAIINSPDSSGLSCAFVDSSIVLPNLGNYGLPAFIDSYLYSSKGTCLGAEVSEHKEIKDLQILPNPFTTQTTIKLTQSIQHGNLRIYDPLGKLVREQEFNGSELVLFSKGLESGVYSIHISDKEANIVSTKVIIVNE